MIASSADVGTPALQLAALFHFVSDVPFQEVWATAPNGRSNISHPIRRIWRTKGTPEKIRSAIEESMESLTFKALFAGTRLKHDCSGWPRSRCGGKCDNRGESQPDELQQGRA